MNKGQEAYLAEEMSGQQVQMNLGSGRSQQQQLQVALGHSGMDPQFIKLRIIMHGRIVEYLREKKNAARQSLEQLANRLENEMYRLHPMKADYYVMLKEPTEQLVKTAIRVLSTHGHQRQKMLNQTQTSSIYGTMVPPLDAMSNDLCNPSTSIQQNSTTSSVSPVTFPVSMQRQVTHVIATPGFSHQHTLRANSESLNVAGYFNGDSNAVAHVQHKQQKPLSVNQSTYPVQQPSNHVDSGVHSRMLENSSYDLSYPQIDGGMELHGSNMLLTNRDAASEAFINLPPYWCYPDKALKQEFNLPTSSGISVSENGSSALTTKRANFGLFASQTTNQQLQPKPCQKSEELDEKEKVNFRKSMLSQEHLLQWPHQLKPNLPCSQYVQNQEVLKQYQLGLYSKETGDNENMDQMSGQLPPQNIHTGVPSDSQQLLPARSIWMNNEIQDDCCQGTMSQDLAQQPVSSDWLRAGCSMNSVDPKLSKFPTKGPEQTTENIKCYYQQLRWLLLLIHAKSCPGSLSSCKSQYCAGAQDVLKHFKNCQRKDCSYRYCRQSKMLIFHYRNCVNKYCPLCSKAKESLHRCANQSNKRSHAEPTFNMEPYTIERVIDGIYGDRMDTKLVTVETCDDQPPVSKRIKQSMYPNVSDGANVPVPPACSEFVLQKAHPEHLGKDKRRFPNQEQNMKTHIRLPQKPAIISFGTVEKIGTLQSCVTPGIPSKLHSHFEDVLDIKKENCSTDVTLSKTGTTKRKGISLMETFTPEQVYEHIFSLRQWVGQGKAKAEKNQAMGHSENENSCQICKLERLTFEPPPTYCSPCGSRIKQNAPYYIASISESGRYNFCVPCYTESSSDTIFVDNIQLLKSKLEKRRNDDELEEAWVACDKCKCWQHQICALFNAKRNDEEKEAEFTCHYCYIQEIKHGLRAPLPQSTVPGAKDLPRTLLSNHIEERLFERLKEERHDRAKKFGKNFDELGEFIYPMKEDFIMVHLQYSCSHCCVLMVSGRRWECSQCKSFYICDKCYNAERQREEKERHPSNSTDMHMLHEVEIAGVPEDTKDRDDIIESEFFDTRQAFLSLCQGNHYQYDTLRSAKHSSMMVLYHLHNPTEPAFVTTCNVCDNDIKTGQGWRCKECDYDECAACYQEHGGINHVHRLTKHSAGAGRDVQNIQQKRVQRARIMLGILTHAVACRAPGCQHPNCRKIKALFHHGTKCQQRVLGGCPLCKNLWGIIHFHARACKESQCRVPRCRDLKEHMRRVQRQSETRRRAAVNEMMRQRAAEAGVKQ